jgi:hypothetical protein
MVRGAEVRAEQIARALGGAARAGRGWVARCCCHKDKNPSLSLCDGDDGKLLVKCFTGCDPRDILAELRRRGLLDDRRDFRPSSTARAPLPPKRVCSGKDGHSDFAAAIWREAVDPRGTLAERYLNGRGIELAEDLCGRVLRFHRHCPFGKDDAGKTIYVPALVVAFRRICDDDENRPPQAIHRIGLKPDGTKIDKMMLGSVGGCAVKLDPDVGKGLGVCEGIETGLKIRARGWRPVWALGSAGAIRTLEPIPGVEALTIFADNDESGTGIEAARECARQWANAGCEAVVYAPKARGKDWADV